MNLKTAIYVRVSTNRQDHRSQLPDLEAFAERCEGSVKWYRDKASGKTMDRPQWKKLEQDIFENKVDQVVVWRLDRLGRTAAGLTQLFDLLALRKVNLISMKDSVDLGTASGKLFANMLASIAQYESELKSERIKAGQAKAKANGKTWGGNRHKKKLKVTPEVERTILRLIAEGVPKSRVAKVVNVSRQTIYKVIAKQAKELEPTS